MDGAGLLRGIAAALVVVAISFTGLAGANSDEGCGRWSQYTGGCSTGSINGDHVDIGGHTGGGGGAGETRDDQASDGNAPPGPPAADACVGQGRICTGEAVFQPVSLAMSDLASFYPQKPTISEEPNGWAIIGLDTNFVADPRTHSASGSLLGRPATVRFTPQAFSWDYGDGIRAETATGGRTWKELGLPEFSPTPTSHVYSAPGSYGVSLSVQYTAQYRIGSAPWQDVPGTLALSAPTFTVIAADAKTVLVQRNCQLDPRGPGC
ncbi:hypothetical protein ACO2Q7_04070 [Rathayibacter sp. KR2-224]|uniref:hypothetical protein n=1 Tax=Rathayibacter sp. KR2-224 TaxID=3400913 RepID=UPI003C0775D7